ncbi:MAG: GNAT family N-acetyltransferase [Coriobacteriales bacterium]|jgi:phosphinothricin acetyltransferase|nr:GNAT family N-acetyltransferase [Coriobacteriales bacterium]
MSKTESNESNEVYEVRLALPTDSQAILDIYEPYVRDTALTFVSSVPSSEEIETKMIQIQKRYPYLVCSCNDLVIGFAYANEVRPAEAYRWNAELSIYLDGRYHRRGIATALYSALLQILRVQGFVNLYAVITIPNEASIALHRHFGFTEIGIHTATGYKFGEWRDVVWMHHRIEKSLDPGEHGLPTKMADLHKNDIDTALSLATAFLKGVGR